MPDKTHKHYADEVVEICKKLHHQGCLAATDGNVSFRHRDRYFITPSGVAKTGIQPTDLAEIDSDGNIVSGNPSSERFMHLAIYHHCPDAGAVVHAHPPHAIALSIARPDLTWLPEGAMSELILAVGKIPVVPYARPGSRDLADSLLPYLPDQRVMILARHGVICWGDNLEEAYYGVERVEHAAKVLAIALQAGGISELPENEIAALKAMRKQLGVHTL